MRCVSYVIMNAYFFISLFLTSHFIFSICNFECIMTSILFIIFAFSLLMFCNIFLIFISCIIILNSLRWKVAVAATFLIQKSFEFNIFLFFLKITLNIINFLNYYIFIMFWRAVSVIAMLNSRVIIIIFFVLFFYIHFIFWIFLFMFLILFLC